MKTFPQRPYFDTFSEDNKFLQVLFRPGFGVQTRELNELQSILQNQIGSMGDSIFANGARVIGGETAVNRDQAFVKITTKLPGIPDAYEGLTIRTTLSTISGTIVKVDSSGLDADTIYVDYTSANTSTGAETFIPGDALVIEVDTLNSVLVQVGPTAAAIGTGVSSTVNKGIYYVDRRFMVIDKQSIIVKPEGDIESDVIELGLDISQTLVTPEEDVALLDNALGSPNESAPGAHRYKIDIKYVDKATLADVTSFVRILTVRNGEIVAAARINEFAALEEILARRTYDESGDYTVVDFNIETRNHLNNGTNRGLYTAAEGGSESKFGIVLDPGKAYVNGYEIQTLSSTILESDKARDVASKDELKVSMPFGTRFVIRDVINLPSIFSRFELRDSAQIIGYAYVKSIYYRGVESGVPVYNLEFFNPSFTVAGKSLSNVNRVTDDDSSFDAQVSRYETGSTTAITRIPFGFIQNVSDLDVYYIKEYTASISSGTARIAANVGDQFISNEPDFYLVTVNGVTKVADSVARLSGNTQADLGVSSFSPPVGATARVFAMTYRNNASYKTKTLISKVASKAAAATVTLDDIDVQSIDSIMIGTVDYTSSYILDGGQRDTHYGPSRLTLRSGGTPPVGTLVISYKYFQHSAGDYFGPSSYDTIAYEDIPSYTNSTGEKLFLGSCLDFRPAYSSDLTYNTTTALSFSSKHDMDASFTYYLSRIDKVTLNKNGNFSVVKGVPGVNPVAPADLDGAMTLYELLIPAYTFSVSEIKASKVSQKRFTMKDIGKIKSRVDNLEYVVALSLLESDANQKELVDKFKCGFAVDNFKSQNVCDFENGESRIGFDLINGEGRPISPSTMVHMELDPTQSSGYVVKGKKVMLPFTEKVEAYQPLASRVERLQPFTLYSWEGSTKLIPESDTWSSTDVLPDQIIADAFTTNLLNTALATTPQLAIGTFFDWWGNRTTLRNMGMDIKANNGRIYGGEVTTELQSTAVSYSAVPFIRSRDVEFISSGQKPFTKVKAYFDNVDVSAFVKPAGGNFGDPLTVNGAGQVIGTFRIPNNDSLRFRTGNRLFEVRADDYSTTAAGTYSANGILQSIQRTITASSRITRKTDPLAQSFSIGQKGGAFISSIDLWFGPDAAGNQFDVSVEIRGMTNGYPNEDLYGRATVGASSILGSSDATVATKFTFDTPIYVEEDEEFCFVVRSNSETLTMFIAELGDQSIEAGGVAGEVIAKQPFIGSLFKSQNNITWEASQNQDAKFRINIADFQTGTGTVVLKNKTPVYDIGTESDPYKVNLGFDPFEFTSGSPVIKITDVNHGFVSGSVVTITGPSTGTINGIPVTDIYNIEYPVTVIDTDQYSITVPGSATSSSRNGGSGQAATRMVRYSIITVAATDTVLTDTNIEYQVRNRSLSTGSVGQFYPVEPRTVFSLQESGVIYGSDDNSMFVKATLTSEVSNLSPVIDIETFGVVCAKNRINDRNDVNGAAACRYIQKPVTLVNPANEISVYLDINYPPDAEVTIFYRTGQSSATETPYAVLPMVSQKISTDNEKDFNEHYFNVKLPNEFYVGQIKIAISSSNEAKPAKIKNLRVLYVNGS